MATDTQVRSGAAQLTRAHVVVCVDDEPPILSALQRLLRREPYRLLLTDKPSEALEWIEKQDVSVIIADQRMPEMCGTDLLKEVRARRPETIRVLLTGYADTGAISEAVNGVSIRRLIMKPWDDARLRRTILDLLFEREAEASRGDGETAVSASLTEAQRLKELVGRQSGAMRLWQEALDTLASPLAVVSADLRIEYCNLAFHRLLGATAVAPRGADAKDVLPREVFDRVREVFRTGVESVVRDVPLAGQPISFELKWLAGAEAVLVRIRAVGSSDNGSGTRLGAPTPRPSEAIEPVRITRRQRAVADQVQHQVELLDAILAASQEPVGAIDRSGRHIYVSPAGARWLGRGRRAVEGKTWGELGLPAEVREQLNRQFEAAVAAGRPVTGELTYPGSSGGRLFECTVGPIHGEEGGEVELLVYTLRDVTDRRRAEYEQHEIGTVLENAVEGISRLDRDGRYVSVNPSCAQMLGYAPDELVGRTWHDTVHPEDRPLFEAAVQRLMVHGRAEVEARAVRKDGSHFDKHVLMTATYGADGELAGYYHFIKDITERRRAEEERTRLTTELLQAQKIQAIGQLAAGIAHEINNPVGYMLTNLAAMRDYLADLLGIVRAAQSLSGADDPPRAREELERVLREVNADFLVGDFQKALDDCREGAERIRDIVKSLREFSHLDEGEMRAVDLTEGLESTIRICWNELKHRATVHRDYGVLPAVICQPQRIDQVFMNVLINAAQAIEKRGAVYVSARHEGAWAVVRIRDTGCGIAPEHRRRIFEPFFTTKPVGQGTGLGLHVAYQIVKAHGGAIEVSSEVGKGTEVAIRLPVAGPGGVNHGEPATP